MVERLMVVAGALYALPDEPFTRLAVKAGRINKIFCVVAVVFVPTRVENDDIAGLDFGPVVFKVLGRDDFPALLRDVDADGVAEGALQGNLVYERGALDDMRWGVGVGGAVHESGELLAEDLAFGVIVKLIDFQVRKIGPQRGAVSPGVAQVDELIVIQVVRCR
jgi:hypothetical protein